jgi:hypothetical protein
LSGATTFVLPTFTLLPFLFNTEDLAESVFAAGFTGQGVLNKDPNVWINGGRPPLVLLVLSFYCEEFPSETATFVQSNLFNYTIYRDHQSIKMKYLQVKTERGVSGEGRRDRKRAMDKRSERQNVRHKWK